MIGGFRFGLLVVWTLLEVEGFLYLKAFEDFQLTGRKIVHWSKLKYHQQTCPDHYVGCLDLLDFV